MAPDGRGLRSRVPGARRPRAGRRALMKLVFVTQTLDPAHGSLAQTLDLVRALSERVDELVVLCRTAEWDEIPANVEVRTFEASSRSGRVLAFERELASASRDADAVFVHMV